MPISTDPQGLPVGGRYRRRRKLLLTTAAVGVALGVLSAPVPRPIAPWIGFAALSLAAASLLIFFTSLELDCPSCHRSMAELAAYCPSCGEPGLVVDRWRGTRCEACKKALRHLRRRTYRIRFCTHCGILIDRRGI